MELNRDIKFELEREERVGCHKAQRISRSIEMLGWSRCGKKKGDAMPIPDELIDRIREYLFVDVTSVSYNESKTLRLVRRCKISLSAIFSDAISRNNNSIRGYGRNSSIWQFRLPWMCLPLMHSSNCVRCGGYYSNVWEKPECIRCDCDMPDVGYYSEDEYDLDSEDDDYNMYDDWLMYHEE